MKKSLALVCLLSAAACLAGCGSSASVGYRIPGTPVSVGASVPLDQSGRKKAAKITYLPIAVSSVPSGARIEVEGQMVGSTPMTVWIPFDKKTFGGAKGSAQVLVKKDGYLPEGKRIFAVHGDQIALGPKGAPVEKLEFTLRR